MPSEQRSNQAGFTGAGWTDDGDVLARLNGEINLLKNGVACGRYADVVEYNRRGARGGGGWLRWSRDLMIDGAEWFEQAEGDVAVGGVLPCNDGHFLTKSWQVQRPIHKQQNYARFAGTAEV